MSVQAEGRQRGNVGRQRVEASAGEQGRGVAVQQVGHLVPGVGIQQMINGGFGILLREEIIGGGAVPLAALVGPGLLAQEIVEDVMIAQRAFGGLDHEQVLAAQVGQHRSRVARGTARGQAQRVAGLGGQIAQGGSHQQKVADVGRVAGKDLAGQHVEERIQRLGLPVGGKLQPDRALAADALPDKLQRDSPAFGETEQRVDLLACQLQAVTAREQRRGLGLGKGQDGLVEQQRLALGFPARQCRQADGGPPREQHMH